MSLKAVLTVGWRDDAEAANSAVRLCEALAATPESGAIDPSLATPVTGLDRLFRLRVGGFGRLQRTVAALADHAARRQEDVYCHIDAFSYAFLRAAKNFDLVIPEARPPAALEPEPAFRRLLPDWKRAIDALHEFERVGRPIAEAERRRYLALRRVVARSTARDERRILAILLVSGPSTAAEVSDDLALPYSLGDRVFLALEEAGALERAGDRFSIRLDALPRVLFCLRSTLGIDHLSILGGQSWKN